MKEYILSKEEMQRYDRNTMELLGMKPGVIGVGIFKGQIGWAINHSRKIVSRDRRIRLVQPFDQRRQLPIAHHATDLCQGVGISPELIAEHRRRLYHISPPNTIQMHYLGKTRYVTVVQENHVFSPFISPIVGKARIDSNINVSLSMAFSVW